MPHLFFIYFSLSKLHSWDHLWTYVIIFQLGYVKKIKQSETKRLLTSYVVIFCYFLFNFFFFVILFIYMVFLFTYFSLSFINIFY